MSSHNSWKGLAALVVATALVLAVAAPQAKAQATYTWTGTIGSAWDDPMNWDPSTGPPTGPDPVDTAKFTTAGIMAGHPVAELPVGATAATLSLENAGLTYTIQNGSLILGDVPTVTTGLLQQVDPGGGSMANNIISSDIEDASMGVKIDVQVASLTLSGKIGTFGLPLALAPGSKVDTGATLTVTNTSDDPGLQNHITGTLDVSGTLSGAGNALGSAAIVLDNGILNLDAGAPPSYEQVVMADSPVVYYRFEEANNTLPAVDTAGGDQNGIYLNQAAPGQTSASTRLGNAVVFDGNDDSVEIQADLTSPQMTIETWFNADTLSGWRSILNDDGWSASSLHYQFNNMPLRWCINGNGGDVLLDWAPNFVAGQWYHVVTTYDGASGAVELYVDGTNVFSGADNGNNDPVINHGNIGAWHGDDREWDGYMDEFAIYDTVLDPTQVANHYLMGGTGAVAEVTLGNDVTVKGFSQINPTGMVHLGDLTIHGGAIFNATGGGQPNDGLSFTSTTIDDTTPGAVTFNTALDVPAGPLTLGATGGDTITQSGAGTTTFTTVASNVGAGDTLTLQPNAGELAITGQVGGATDPITIHATVPAAGRLAITHADPASPSNIPVASTFQVNGGVLEMGTKGTQSSLGDASVVLNGGTMIHNASGLAAGARNRWRFDEVGVAGTVLTDSISSANATIIDQGAQDADVGTTVAGQLYMTGGGKNDSDYLKLDNGIISSLGDATFEFWATQKSVKNWGRIFSFGSSDSDVFLSAWTRGNDINTDALRWVDAGVTLGDNDSGNVSDTMAPFTIDQEFHLVYVVDEEATGPDSKTVVTWYKDGVLAGSFDTFDKLSDLGDTESVLGRSKWGDDTANAAYNEFRIYDAALDAAEIALSYAEGPDVATFSEADTDVHVTASAEIQTNGGGGYLGDLTIDKGLLLTTSGGWLGFDSTTLGLAGAGDYGVQTDGDLRVGQLLDSDQGGGLQSLNLDKTGDGAIVFDRTDVAGNADEVLVRVWAGTVGIVKDAGGIDPLGGAVVQILPPADVVFASKDTDVTVGTKFDIDDPTTFTAKKAYSGTAGGAKVTLTGAIDVNALATLTMATEDGYTLAWNATGAGGGDLIYNAGNHQVISDIKGLGNVSLAQAGAVVEVLNDDAFAAAQTVDIAPDAFLKMTGTGLPAGPNMPSSTTVEALGALGGDITKATYGAGGNVTLVDSSVLAHTTGAEPLVANLPPFALLYRGITDTAATYIIGDGGGANDIYKGAMFSPAWTSQVPHTISGPGLFYGEVPGMTNDQVDPNPNWYVTVDLHETEDSIPGNTTEVYTGQFYDLDGVVEFCERIDDETRIYIDGVKVLESIDWNDRAYVALALDPHPTLDAGWHEFELRIGNGGGGAGPIGGELGIGFDPAGTSGAVYPGAYVHLEDPGDSSLLRVQLQTTDFVGTLQEAAGANGFEVHMTPTVGFMQATFNAVAGHEIKLLGDFNLGLSSAWRNAASTADTFLRQGSTPPVGDDPGTTGDTLLTLQSMNAIPAGVTMTIENGRLAVGATNAVADDPDGDDPLTGGTMVIGQNALFNCVDNADGRRPSTGDYEVAAGGIIRINNNNRLKNGAGFTFDPDAYVYMDSEIKVNEADPNYEAGVNLGFDNVNIIITDDRYRDGLFLGQGRRLTTPSRQNQNTDVTGGNMGIIGPSLSAPPTYVIFSNARKEDGHLEIRANVELPGVDVYINDPPGTLFSLPQHDNTLQREIVEMDGYVLWDEGTATFQNLDVRNGRLRLGENNNFNIVSTGSMTIRSGVEYVDLRANYDNLVPQLADGTLFPNGIFVENGPRLELRYRRDTGDGDVILQPITFLNVGTGLTTFQPNRENGGGNVYFKDITLGDGVDVSVRRQDVGQKELHMDITMSNTATLSGDGCNIDSLTAPGPATVFIGNRAVDDLRGNDPSYAIPWDLSDRPDILWDIQEGHNNDGALQLYHGRQRQPAPNDNLYAWGDLAVIHVGNRETVAIRADADGNNGVYHRGDDNGPLTNVSTYINQFNGYILVENRDVGPDANLRGWRWDNIGGGDGHARVKFNNIHLEDGADVEYSESWCFVDYENVYLEGPTGQVSNYNGWDGGFRVGNIINDSGDPDAVVTLNARNRMRAYGTLGLDAVVVSNDDTGAYSDGNYGFHMVPGFLLNNHKLTITQGTDQQNRLWTDPGLGVIDFSEAQGGGPRLELWHGNDQPPALDPNEFETVWGADTTVLLGNDREFKIKVDRARDPDTRYWNTFAGPVIVKNNVAGDSDDADNARDGFLYVERHSNTGSGYDIVGGHFANVHLEDGAQVRVGQGNALNHATITLDGATGYYRNSNNNDRIFIRDVTGNATPGNEVLTVVGNNRTRFIGTLDGADIDINNNNQSNLQDGFALNNNAVSMIQTGGGDRWLDVETDPGAGTINNTTASANTNSVNIYYGMDGSGGLTPATIINLDNDNRVRVNANRGGPPPNVSDCQATINVLGTGLLEGADQGAGNDGFAFFSNVNLSGGSVARLEREGGAVMGSFNLLGPATVSNTAGGGWTCFLKDTTGTGILTLAGIEEFRLVGTLGTDVIVTNTDGIRFIDEASEAIYSSGVPIPAGLACDLNGHTVDLYLNNNENDLWSDPGDGTIISTRVAPGYTVTDRNNWRQLELRYGRFQPAEGVAETAWGDDLEIIAGGQTMINMRVNEAAGADNGDNDEFVYTNHFLGTIRVRDDVQPGVLPDLGADGTWLAQADAQIKGERWDKVGDDDVCSVLFENVVLEPGATLVYNEGWCRVDVANVQVLRDPITSIGDAYLQNRSHGNNMYIGDVHGDLTRTGDETLKLLQTQRFRMEGIIHAGVNVEVTCYNDEVWLEEGFGIELGGNLIVTDGRIQIQDIDEWAEGHPTPGAPPTGDGLIKLMRAGGQTSNSGEMRIRYGKGEDPADLLGDNGWGAGGPNIEMYYANMVRLYVDEPIDVGDTNVNKYEGTIVTKSDGDPATIDGRLRAERGGNDAGAGIAWFADIQPDVDSQTQLERGGEQTIRATFDLEGGNAEAVVNGGIPAIIEATSLTPRVLTIDRNGGGNATLDLTMLGSADMDIDRETGDVVRIGGLHLNNNTLSIRRGGTVEVWHDCNTDPGDGLIDVAGYDAGGGAWTRGLLEFRTAREGGDALERALTEVKHDGMLSGYVATKYVQAVQNFAADVKIIDAGTDRDAELRTRVSDDATIHEGWTPGQVKFSSLTMGGGAKAELTRADWGGMQSQLYIENAHIEGAAEIFQNVSLIAMFIGNTDGAGTLTVGGSQPIHLTGNLAAATRVNGWAMIEPSATLTGPVEVDDGGICILAKPGVTADNFTVKDGGVLAITDTGFLPGAMTVETGGAVALAANLAWDDDDVNATGIFIAKENYNSIITLDNPATLIGGVWTDRAGITQPLDLADTATTVNFGGGDEILTVAAGVLHDTPLPNPVAVNFNQDVRVTGASSHTGLNTIGATVYAMDQDALGGGGGGGCLISPDAELRVLAGVFDSAGIDVDGAPDIDPLLPYHYSVLDLRGTTVNAPVNFGGGIIRAAGATTVMGAITEDDNITFDGGGAVTFSDGTALALAADRTWTVGDDTTAALAGQITSDIPDTVRTLTKAGRGTLRLDGGVDPDDVNLILGASPGSLTVIGSAGTVGAVDSVTINAEAAYGVEKDDHPYTEVDMLNSVGCIALGGKVNPAAVTLTMGNAAMTLGACNDVEFAGTLVPSGNTFQLGGGGATLTIAGGVLAEQAATLTNVQIGRNPPASADDITHAGMVQVNGHQTVTGNVDIYGAAGVQDENTFWSATLGEAANVVNVWPGGTLDLGATDVTKAGTLMLKASVVPTDAGGGVARNTGTITVADSVVLFSAFQDYVFGGAGLASDGNETKLEDGVGSHLLALNLIKVGSNQVRMLAPATPGASLNTYGDDNGETRVEDGRLVVMDVSSLSAAAKHLRVQGDGVAEFEAGGTLPNGADVILDGDATLEIVEGETLTAGGLSIGTGAGADVTITTQDTGALGITAPAELNIGTAVAGGVGGTVNLDNATMTAQYGGSAARFRIMEDSLLNFPTAGNGSGIGSMLPKATLKFGDDVDPLAVAVNANVGGGSALTFDVDPDAGSAGWSNGTDRVYTVNVVNSIDPLAGTSEIDITSGDGIRSASYADDADIRYRPVAHIAKTGDGILRTAGGTFNSGSTTVTRKLAWDIVGGTLEATAGDGSGLGPDAYAWVMGDKRPTIANQHVESIDVRGGATLAWGGAHGFLADTTSAEGDGFNNTEFRMYDGSTLQGNNLQLGFYQTFAAPNAGTDTYLCYPTLVGSSPVNVTFAGSINFDSGIATASADPVNVTTAGNVRFRANLAGAQPVDVIDTLTVQSGITGIYKDHNIMQTTDIQSGGMQFDPGTGNQITYNGPVTNNGSMTVVSGTVVMPQIITSTASALPIIYEASINEGANWVGSYTEAGGVHTIQASGGDIWGANDGMYFVYQERDAAVPFDIHAYVGAPTGFTSIEPGDNINDWAKAGIQVRQTLDQKSQNAMVLIAHKDGNGMNAQVRPAYDAGSIGSNTTGSRINHNTPVWLRLTYDGANQFETYYSEDPAGTPPTTWNKFSNDSAMAMNGGSELGGMIRVGLAVTAHNTNNLTQIEFQDVHGLQQPSGILDVVGGKLEVGGFQGLNQVSTIGDLTTTAGGTSSTRKLIMDAGSTFDLQDGNLVVDYEPGANPFDELVALVAKGFNNIDTDDPPDGYPNLWEGTGITSANARDNSQLTTGLAIIDNDDVLSHTVPPKVGGLSQLEAGDGVTLDATCILIKYTWNGDANLDGKIDSNDYDLIDTAWLLWENEGRVPEGGFRYAVGDFNFDGTINSNDYDKIDNAYTLQTGTLGGNVGGGGGPLPTPEPATLMLLGLGAAAALLRRRRSR